MNENENLRERYNPEGSELRKLQLKMLDILSVVADICDRHNLTYWISGGTLLGAVVHKGFIPWDDDIDVEMPLADYKRLIKILPKELPPHLYLQTPEEKWNTVLFSKVRDRNSIVYIKGEESSKSVAKGFFIDIVPVEGSYMWMKKMLDSMYGRAFRRIRRGQPLHSLRYFFEYGVSLFLYPLSALLVFLARVVCSAAKPGTLVYGYGINAKHGQKSEDILPTGLIKFEGKEFSAPRNPHNYLYTQYKCDYTKIPPESGRPQHFLKVEYL